VGYLEGRYEFIAIVARDALRCGPCAAIEERGYAPWDLPELPNGDCTRPGGCRCRYEPAITVVE
jgi:hypothetical protein